jgi:aminopeptidase N
MARHDPHSHTDLAQGRLRHVDFSFDVDFTRRRLRGSARYRLDRPARGPFDLDTGGLEITSVATTGGSLAYELGEPDPILGSRLRLTGLNGHEEFTVDFVALDRAQALQWLTPAQTAGGRHPFLFTQCQPHHARTIFPCQDSPSVRFTYRADVRVPSPLFAAASGAPLGGEPADGATVFRFDMPQPIPSYLFALAVGDLTSRDLSPRSRVYAEPEVIEAAAWEFGQIEDMMVEAEKLYGPYPWERYDMLVLPPSFPYGGMENARLTFLTPTMIVGDRSLTNLLAHELAHSWTGNLVTNATWEDFWLNEGWTTYAERRILGALEGEESAMLRAATGRTTMLRDVERFGWESPPTRLKFSQVGIDPESVVSYIAYEKGYSFLVRLERIVGRRAFDTFTRRYIAEHRFETITTEAFIQLLRRDLPQAFAKVDVEAWLYGPGFPSDAPPFESRLIDEVSSRLFDYQEGRLPRRADVQTWQTAQTYLFLQHVPRVIPLDHCRAIESSFALAQTRVPVFLSQFLEIAIRSGYRECLPRAEALISTVGRVFIIRPVFQALAETEWSRPSARPLLEKVRPRHHPITIQAMEHVLSQAGV